MVIRLNPCSDLRRGRAAGNQVFSDRFFEDGIRISRLESGKHRAYHLNSAQMACYCCCLMLFALGRRREEEAFAFHEAFESFSAELGE